MFDKITGADLAGKGVIGLPDTPELSTEEMQQKFEETARDVIIPKFNALIDSLSQNDAAEQIGAKTIEGLVGTTVQQLIQALKQKIDDINLEIVDQKVPDGSITTPKFAPDAKVPFSGKADSALNGTVNLQYAKSGIVHQLTGLGDVSGTISCVFTATAAFAAGDTFTVDGDPYVIQLSNGEEAEDNLFVSGAAVPVIVDTGAKKINFKAGGGGYQKNDIIAPQYLQTQYEDSTNFHYISTIGDIAVYSTETMNVDPLNQYIYLISSSQINTFSTSGSHIATIASGFDNSYNPYNFFDSNGNLIHYTGSSPNYFLRAMSSGSLETFLSLASYGSLNAYAWYNDMAYIVLSNILYQVGSNAQIIAQYDISGDGITALPCGVDADGNLYHVSVDSGSYYIIKRTPTGSKIWKVSTSSSAGGSRMACIGDYMYYFQGTSIRRISLSGTVDSSFSIPSSLSYHNGNLIPFQIGSTTYLVDTEQNLIYDVTQQSQVYASIAQSGVFQAFTEMGQLYWYDGTTGYMSQCHQPLSGYKVLEVVK